MAAASGPDGAGSSAVARGRRLDCDARGRGRVGPGDRLAQRRSASRVSCAGDRMALVGRRDRPADLADAVGRVRRPRRRPRRRAAGGRRRRRPRPGRPRPRAASDQESPTGGKAGRRLRPAGLRRTRVRAGGEGARRGPPRVGECAAGGNHAEPRRAGLVPRHRAGRGGVRGVRVSHRGRALGRGGRARGPVTAGGRGDSRRRAENAASPLRHTVAPHRRDRRRPDWHRPGVGRRRDVAGARLRRRPRLECAAEDAVVDPVPAAASRRPRVPHAAQRRRGRA